MSGYWPWWLGALALGTVAVGFYLAVGRLLGVSGSFARVLDGPDANDRGRITWGAHVTLLAAILLGGTLGAWTRGTLHLRLDLGGDFTHVVGSGWHGLAALAGGGVLVGFGTAMAGGCTSGHGLCGTSRLQPGSLVATAAFFGAAVGVSLLLSRLA